jgi:peptide subunit release factor 1 (eRF1)
MAASTTTRGRLRRLAEVHPQTGRVLSIYVDLDPSEFGTARARASQLTSLFDEAAKAIEAIDGLEHDELVALRADLERMRDEIAPEGLGEGGVRGLAIFACGPAGLFEVVRLPYPVQSRVVIDRNPFLEPIAVVGERERWCVILASRTVGRILLGDEDGLEEVEELQDDVHGQHKQGGWSQARYQRSVEREKDAHLDHVADEAFAVFRFRPFDRLLVGAPEPLDHELESKLHPYLKERLAGRVQIDVENAGPSDVLAAAASVFEQHRRAREDEALERLRAGLGRPGGLAVAGLPDVLEALNERRVEVLLLEPRASAHGWVDPVTGFLAADPNASPRPGAELLERDDVIEDAMERAIEQSAEIMVVRYHADLGPHGGIAAVLRF